MTTETSERLRELENKNIEYEDEIQSLNEENNMINYKNKELLEIINLLNIRLKELNRLVYDFSRDKPQDETMKTNAELINQIDGVKEEKMMIETELNKLKVAIEKHKIRTSRPEAKKDFDYPNSPASFDFDGEDNEIFGESFVIDSSNKEFEEKYRILQDEMKEAQDTLEDKDNEIKYLTSQIFEFEKSLKSGQLDLKKSESFEIMNSDTIGSIKGVLIQFLSSVPISDKTNESLLDVLFDMLHITHQETIKIKEARKKLVNSDTPKKKNGFFSRMIK